MPKTVMPARPKPASLLAAAARGYEEEIAAAAAKARREREPDLTRLIAERDPRKPRTTSRPDGPKADR